MNMENVRRKYYLTFYFLKEINFVRTKILYIFVPINLNT